MVVLDAPVAAAGRLELSHYLREQTVSRVVHRYGSVMQTATPLATPRLDQRISVAGDFTRSAPGASGPADAGRGSSLAIRSSSRASRS